MSVNGVNNSSTSKYQAQAPTYTKAQEEEMLFKNVDKFDTAAGGKKDGKVGLEDLRAVAADKNNQSEEAKMIRHILKEHPEILMETGIAKTDKNGDLVNAGGADKKDIEQAIKEEKKKTHTPSSKPEDQNTNGPKPKS